MINVPSDDKGVLKLANELIEQCRVSVPMRGSYYRLMNLITETGRYDGTKSLINTLFKHLDRTAAHLFSPIDLKFSVSFTNSYPERVYEQAKVVARVLTQQWQLTNTDVVFGKGVFEALKYGACILKQFPQYEGQGEHPTYNKKLVMPWQFGVYNECETDINKQPVLCESTMMTLPEVWRRIYHLPNADKLYRRIESHGMSGQSIGDPQNYFHTILSASQLNTSGVSSVNPGPGGFVQINNSANYSMMGPQVAAPVVLCHELWVQDADDYTTIIMIEPDIIIAPIFKKQNLLSVSQKQPYRLIQPNEVTNWFWGRSELVDLIEPQSFLSTTCDDFKRLIGLQVDKILGFTGDTQVTDEMYGQFRQAGYINLGMNADVKDVTPKFPAELLPVLKFLLETLGWLGGFPPIMQGQGESGVRAGVHANTLLKTASPTLRDRALLVERQCAMAADLSLAIREAKDPCRYWTKGDTPASAEETSFLLADLPDDWIVSVDSHSSSPIFSDENTQLVFAGHKMGIVDGEYVIDNTAFPNKEAAKQSLRNKQAAQAEQMQKMITQFPEAGEKIAAKMLTGRR